VLNAAFTAEMLLRVAAAGGPLSYLSQPWNVFDAVMVAAGYTMFVPITGDGGAGLEGLRALRALRALRPLRAITRFPALRSIVACFLEAVPLLVSVGAMLGLFLFVFGVTGAELFSGAYHRACVDDRTGAVEDPGGYGGEWGCGARRCPDGYTCQARVRVDINLNFQSLQLKTIFTYFYRLSNHISALSALPSLHFKGAGDAHKRQRGRL
jgi:hypothetical protein